MKKTILALISFCTLALNAGPSNDTARLLQQTANDIARAQQILALQQNGGKIAHNRLATIHMMNHTGSIHEKGTLPANINTLQDALIKEPLLKVLSATPFSDAKNHLKLTARARKALKRYMKQVGKLAKDSFEKDDDERDDDEDEDERDEKDEKKDKDKDKKKKDRSEKALKAVVANEDSWDTEEAEEENRDNVGDEDSDDDNDDDDKDNEEKVDKPSAKEANTSDETIPDEPEEEITGSVDDSAIAEPNAEIGRAHV